MFRYQVLRDLRIQLIGYYWLAEHGTLSKGFEALVGGLTCCPILIKMFLVWGAKPEQSCYRLIVRHWSAIKLCVDYGVKAVDLCASLVETQPQASILLPRCLDEFKVKPEDVIEKALRVSDWKSVEVCLKRGVKRIPNNYWLSGSDVISVAMLFLRYKVLIPNLELLIKFLGCPTIFIQMCQHHPPSIELIRTVLLAIIEKASHPILSYVTETYAFPYETMMFEWLEAALKYTAHRGEEEGKTRIRYIFQHSAYIHYGDLLKFFCWHDHKYVPLISEILGWDRVILGRFLTDLCRHLKDNEEFTIEDLQNDKVLAKYDSIIVWEELM